MNPKPDITTPAPRKKGGSVTYLGSIPDNDPRYQSGWNFLMGKNLRQSAKPSGEKSEEAKKD